MWNCVCAVVDNTPFDYCKGIKFPFSWEEEENKKLLIKKKSLKKLWTSQNTFHCCKIYISPGAICFYLLSIKCAPGPWISPWNDGLLECSWTGSWHAKWCSLLLPLHWWEPPAQPPQQRWDRLTLAMLKAHWQLGVSHHSVKRDHEMKVRPNATQILRLGW